MDSFRKAPEFSYVVYLYLNELIYISRQILAWSNVTYSVEIFQVTLLSLIKIISNVTEKGDLNPQ